ncbi:aldose 1-epimerase [Marinobacter sp. JSM 1782161]|uniref:aldose 1-epimerase n=1 Tax=Marinobacter sp. JSM 1782161 TaxID=2685906 RepID=UPI00140209FC|nr:hypothetical protein [Marinobacter sp. JSM 1782161]
MTTYTATEGRFGPYPTLILQGPGGTPRAEIALRGATLLSLSLPETGPDSVVSGYATPDDFAALTGARSAILAPYSNRLADGRYVFDGAEHQFAKRDDDGNSLHGLVMDAVWQAGQIEPGADRIAVELTCDTLRSAEQPGYPFHVHLSARFELSGDGLRLTLTARNDGESDAPLGLGWHPYLRLPGQALADCRLTLPHTERIVSDARLIPLPGNDAYQHVRGTEHDFCAPGRALAQSRLDDCYWGPNGNGGLVSTLTGSDGRSLTLTQDRGVVQVYTGHSLPADQPSGLAIEPNEFMPDAFNRPELARAIRLVPGAERSFGASLRVRREHTG